MSSEISTSVINSMINKIKNPSGVSDGYHTFQELYDDRACMLFLIMIVLCFSCEAFDFLDMVYQVDALKKLA